MRGLALVRTPPAPCPIPNRKPLFSAFSGRNKRFYRPETW